ncbi:SDR family NAD(P)-dependent oxidoreductase [Marinomonas balearica]|uniref:NAD(P)-dependent dehydrogenase (Short-subunit alcohol dehydrogenase family) n=1 Tax=Marinomonas balearica TaxID=491947 RepID=A0A4R6M3P8_9GAMM|nr:SDR family oxidoreductase [Marinomonas balearica]TDO95814.1 NAD(P)-dependent dehydrogenase (short-subunit alcohol dehydrogenase family) [Marinomonas balearica]
MTSVTKYSSVEGQHVLVTGGASGIGEAIVEAFAKQGARVSFFDLDEKAGSALVARLEEKGFDVHFSCVDLMDIESLQTTISSRINAWGYVATLINNAANDQRHDLQSMTSAQFDACMQVNLKHHFFAAQSVATGMAEQGAGSIINMSSNSWMLGLSGYPGYVTAKAGISGLTKGLARELGGDGIRVNTVLPGWVMTQKQKDLWLTPEAEAELMVQQALKTKIEPEDVANMVVFLAADESRMISGQSLVVDGGRL